MHGRRDSSLERLTPAQRTEAPLVARHEARKAWQVWCGQVVSARAREIEEGFCGGRAHDVPTVVVVNCVAKSIPKVTGHWRSTARLEFAAEGIFGRISGGLCGLQCDGVKRRDGDTRPSRH